MPREAQYTMVLEYEYFHIFGMSEQDTSDFEEHYIYIYAFTRDMKRVLIRTKYEPFFNVKIISSKLIKWDKNKLKQLYEELRTRGRFPLLNDEHYTSSQTFVAREYVGYLNGPQQFLKVRYKSRKYLYNAKERFNRNSLQFGNTRIRFSVEEAAIESILTFRTERGIKMAGWIKIPKKEIEEGEISTDDKIWTCGPEYLVDWQQVYNCEENDLPVKEQWRVYPNIVGYDIEAQASSKKVFPRPHLPSNPATMISVYFQTHAKPETKKRYCIVLGDAKTPPDAICDYVESEEEMREKFCLLLAKLEADILVGHYNMGFDDNYLNQRALNKWQQWPTTGSRMKDCRPEYRDFSWTSKNSNKVDIKYIDFPGRMTFDTKIITKSNVLVRLPDYTLNRVAEHYLKRKKRELNHEDIYEIYTRFKFVRDRLEKCIKSIDKDGTLQKHDNVSYKVWKFLIKEYNESMDEMCTLIDYCTEDSALVVDLFEKLNVWINVVEAASTYEVRIGQVYVKGQQYKVMSQLYVKLKEKTEKDPNGVVLNTVISEVDDEGSYEGALNLGTLYGKIGFKGRTASIDVNSMYPSIIAANNLCLSTEISTNPNASCVNITNYKEEDYNRSTWTDNTGRSYDVAFVKESVHVGFLVSLVRSLMAKRSILKKMMEKAPKGSFEYDKLDAAQNSTKISTNSVYGVLGMTKERGAKIPGSHIAALVTKIGRDLDMTMARFIENGGCGHGSIKGKGHSRCDKCRQEGDPIDGKFLPPGEIVYGDTDSVQFKIIGDYTIEETIRICYRYEAAINRHIAPLKIELEKFGDMMIIAPKKYIYHFIDRIEFFKDGSRNPNFGKYLYKDAYKYTGVEFVKRNYPEILKRMYKGVADGIMSDILDMSYLNDIFEDVETRRLQYIIDFIFKEMYKILKNKNDITDYLIYEAYNKETGKLGPFAKNMEAIGKPIQVGERVGYVIVKVPKKRGKKQKKAECFRLIDTIGDNESLDLETYVKNLTTPIDGLMCARFKNSETYDEFYKIKNIQKKVLKLLRKKGYVNDELMRYIRRKTLDKAMINMVKDKVAEKHDVNIPNGFNEFIDFKQSKEYTNYHKNVKGAITRATKITTTIGLPLANNIPEIIENIRLANKLQILDEYAKIMMSEYAYLRLNDV